MRKKEGINFVIFALLANFYITTLFLGFFNFIYIGSIALEGLIRFILFTSLTIIFLKKINQIKSTFLKEKKIFIFIILFVILTFLQIFFLKNKLYHIQGTIKYLFYLLCILLSIYSLHNNGVQVRDKLIIVIYILFFSVVIFYPYLIIRSGLSLGERLTLTGIRFSMILGAGNEDAHFMVTLFPFILYSLYKKKFLLISIIILSTVVLIYNGTRSTLLMFCFVVLLYFTITNKNKILMPLLIVILIFTVGESVGNIFITQLEGEKGIIFNFNDFVQGRVSEGNLAGRYNSTWMPTVLYTIKNSLWIGFGNNGWSEVALNAIGYENISNSWVSVAPHNFFVTCFCNWGLLGLTLFIYLFYHYVKYSFLCLKKALTFNQKRISTALLCSWISFLSWSMIANSSGTAGWTVLVILILLTIINKNEILTEYSTLKKKIK